MRGWLTAPVAVSRGSFVIKFDGPAVDDHRIDVRALAPALIGLADAVASAHLAAGDGTSLPPSLEIGPPDGGSFMAELSLAWDSVVDLLTTEDAVATERAVGLLLIFGGAVKWAVTRRRKGGKGGERVEEIGSGQVRVHYPDGTFIEADARAGGVVENIDFNRAMLTATEPLRLDGINSLEIELEGEPVAEVEPADRPAFNVAPEPDRVVSDNHRIMTVDILKASFKSGNKWHVTDGTTPFWVSIADVEFQRQVEERRVRFAKGDRLTVELHDRQVEDGSGLHTEHEVVRVLRHWTVPPADEIGFSEG